MFQIEIFFRLVLRVPTFFRRFPTCRSWEAAADEHVQLGSPAWSGSGPLQCCGDWDMPDSGQQNIAGPHNTEPGRQAGRIRLAPLMALRVEASHTFLGSAHASGLASPVVIMGP